MSTHNIYFHGEIREIFTFYPLLSKPMHFDAKLIKMDKNQEVTDILKTP